MVPLMSLWLPIVLSAVAVFVASSVVHMALGYHKTDFAPVPDEDRAMDALRSHHLAPGDYLMPYANSGTSMKDPAFLAKVNAGPRVVMTVLPKGMTAMGGLLGKWFVFNLIVSLFAAYLASRVLAPATPYLTVFRVVGTTVFAAYGLGLWPQAIWYGKSTSATVKSTFDAFLYALVSAGVFGWLWPM
jgi:hypothetical protein